jgi:hypothetical protein
MKSKFICLTGAVFFTINSLLGLAFAKNQKSDSNNVSEKAQIKKKKLASEKAETQQNVTIYSHEEMQKLLTMVRYGHGLVVVASPFLGERGNVFATKDLIVNLPSVNTDLQLLEQRRKLDNYAKEHGELPIDRPLVDISGSIEAQGLYIDGYSRQGSQLDIDLTRAELDTVAEAGSWATGDIILNFEKNLPFSKASSTPAVRVSNSRFKVDRAFLTIGNLNKTPFYLTLGQVYVPFGRYSSVMVTNPITKTLGRTKERIAQIGFSKSGFFGALYGFQGDSYVDNKHTIDQWGVNLGYKTGPIYGLKTSVGAGYIANLADTQSLQSSVFAIKSGFPSKPDSEKIKHRVPGLDFNLTLDLDPFRIITEYISAARSFDPSDISFNGEGAKPSAIDIEGVYTFSINDKKYTAGIGYDQSWDSLAVGLPEQSYFAVLSTSIWTSTIASLEYRHNVNYNFSDFASFSSGPNFHKVTIPPQNSRNQNVITLQFGLYF